jgi:hypothetical protein
MKSITIHGLDEKLYQLIKIRSKENGQSLNKTIKSILEKSFGFNKNKKSFNRDEFEEFLGVWSENDAKEFHSNICDLESVDHRDWK